MKLRCAARLGGIALALSVSVGAGEATEVPAHHKWHPWIGLGGYLSNERSRGEGTLWAPVWQSQTALVFTDIRGKFFDEDAQEGNFALGLRVMRPSGWNLGAWGGWDIRHTELNSTFNQASFGFEALRANFDLRANGYVVTDRSHVSTFVTAGTSGSVSVSSTTAGLVTTTTTTSTQTTRVRTTRIFEHALNGFDAEVGFRVPLESWFGTRGGGSSDNPRHELRLYGGGFWFDADNVEEIAGPRLRAELRFNDVLGRLPGSRLTFESEYKYDDVRDHQLEAGVRLRIPFGGRRNGLNAQERRMMERLERDTDIVTNTERTDSTTSTTTTTTSISQTTAEEVEEVEETVQEE